MTIPVVFPIASARVKHGWQGSIHPALRSLFIRVLSPSCTTFPWWKLCVLQLEMFWPWPHLVTWPQHTPNDMQGAFQECTEDCTTIHPFVSLCSYFPRFWIFKEGWIEKGGDDWSSDAAQNTDCTARGCHWQQDSKKDCKLWLSPCKCSVLRSILCFIFTAW